MAYIDLCICAGVSEENVVDTEQYDADHSIAIDLNPSYVAITEVYTCDSNIMRNTAKVHLQANPSYIALPGMVSQGQD